MLASIARSVIDERARIDLMNAEGVEEVLEVLAVSSRRIAEERRSRAPTLADI